MKSNVIFILVIFLAISCKDPSKISSENTENQVFLQLEGKALMESKCYLCHSPSAPMEEERIGPPMVAVKAHYLEEYKSKEEFIKGILDFVNAPSKEKVKLKGAVRRFGVMPYQQFQEEEIRKIADYIFDYTIEEPEWFKAHWEERGGNLGYNLGKMDSLAPNKKQSYKNIGLNYALGTKKVLGKNLMGTIQKEGAAAAVIFCNERAYPLTDSMSIHFNAKIKRVSDKPRNPNNKASDIELAHIATFNKELAAGNPMEPIVSEADGKVDFYYPIVTNSMCLKCHGIPGETLVPEAEEHISQLYPKDMATGYDVNQVRGIWSIVFDEETQ